MQPLYMDDSYLTEFTATVTNVTDEKYVTLDTTAFFPLGGGVAHDTGTLTRISDDNDFAVTFVKKVGGDISHEVSEPGLQVGDEVTGTIDWKRRYRLMRMHTAAHVLAALFHDLGAKITGNSIDLEKSRIDFNLESFDRELVEQQVAKANELIAQGAPVTVSYLPREEVLKIPHLVKLANALPPSVTTLRIVTIKGIDEQADGGCHVKDVKEIGEISLVKIDNKGKSNRRLYYTLDER